MAQKFITEWVDDIDGSEASETVRFSLDGKPYAIDLSEANARALRDALDAYTAAARKGEGSRVRATAVKAGKRQDLAEIRAWANANGFTVADRGRVPVSVVEAYDAAS